MLWQGNLVIVILIGEYTSFFGDRLYTCYLKNTFKIKIFKKTGQKRSSLESKYLIIMQDMLLNPEDSFVGSESFANLFQGNLKHITRTTASKVWLKGH